MSSTTAIILFAHGARDPEWANPLRRVREAMLDAMPAQRVEMAFLEFMSPTLPECVTHLAQEGMQRLVVVPMFIAQGGHLKRDVPALLVQLRQEYPTIHFELAPAVGENDAVVHAMANYALAQA